ncbi:MAG: HlyD family efflux transporter periplasmic adaptor subunit [Flavobacteriales bacterium]|nr:HlyD family efflux transporter periplasmic adaptor subunit [Flavobacteriales bacterium]
MRKLGQQGEPEPASTAEHVKLVQIYVVTVGDQPVNERLTGKVTAARRVMLVAEASGQLQPGSKEIKEGVTFSEGEHLFRIDDAEVRLALVAQRSQFSTLITQLLPDLTLDHPASVARWTAYLAKVNEKEPLPDLLNVDNEKERRFLTSRGVFNLFYSIRSAEAKLSKFGFRAPFGGTISKGNAVPGSHVLAGQQLGELIDASAFEFETTVSAALAARIKVGTPISVFHADDTLTARVVRISDRVDDRTQNVVLFASLAGKGLRDGEYISGSISLPAISDAALLHGRHLVHGSQVFVVSKDSMLSLHPVEMVFRDGDHVVCTGLSEGTRILDNPFPDAHEGMRVVPKR